MKLGRKPGITRRPLEYLLFFIVIGLVILLVWSLSVIKKVDDSGSSDNVNSSQRPEAGTINEIDWLIDKDREYEESLDIGQSIVQSARQTDAAADNIGSIYDETSLNIICQELDGLKAGIMSDFDSRRRSYDEAVGRQQSELKSARDLYASDVVSGRARSDIERANSYELFRTKADDKVKNLVSEYFIKLDEIIAGRRQAYDNAGQKFSQTIDSIIGSRHQLMSMAIEDFRDEVLAGFDIATLDCRRLADNSQISAGLVSELASARLNYAEALRSRPDFSAEVTDNIGKRAQSYQSAQFVFERAVQELKSSYNF